MLDEIDENEEEVGKIGSVCGSMSNECETGIGKAGSACEQ
jgi:hypothetical protein